MSPMDDLAQVFTASLHLRAEALRGDCAGRAITGVCSVRWLPLADAVGLVLQHWEAFEASGIRLFTGESDSMELTKPPHSATDRRCPVIAVPGLSRLDVARCAQVAAHVEARPDFETFYRKTQWMRSRGPTDKQQRKDKKFRAEYELIRRYTGHEGVLSGLSEIMDACPFIITFADPKGLYATFLRPPTARQAAQFGRLIERMDPEVHCILRGESTTAYILARQGFRLWWD